MKGDLYARKSSLDQGRSAARQERDWQNDCIANGIEPGRVFVDPDLSASRFATKHRPQYEELLAHVRSGECLMVCLWEASRGSRRPGEWIDFLDLCRERNVLIRVFSDGGRTYDVRRRRDWRDLAEEGLDARDESEKLSERVRDGKRDSAVQGLPAGMLLFGYTRRYDEHGRFVEQIPHPQQAPIVRRLLEDTIAGTSLNSQAVRLNREGVPTARGRGLWKGERIGRLLMNVGYVGDRVHKGEVVKRDCWPALITREEQATVTTMLTASNRRLPADTSLKHYLSGAARCGACGGPLRVAHRRTYVCPAVGCGKVSAVLHLLEGDVRNVFRARLRLPDGPALLSPMRDSDAIKVAERELQDLQDHLDGFFQQAKQRQLSAAGLARMERELQPQIDAADERVRRLKTPPVLSKLAGVDVPRVWHRLPVGVRRELVIALADVVVSPVGRGGTWGLYRLAGSRWHGDELTWGERWSSGGGMPGVTL